METGQSRPAMHPALEGFTRWADREFGKPPQPDEFQQRVRFEHFWRCWQAAQDDMAGAGSGQGPKSA